MSEQEIIRRLNRNVRRNSWWVNLFGKKLQVILLWLDLTPQAVGVILNPMTGNAERVRILKMFYPRIKNKLLKK